ncbi:MAG TPA: anaerobic ribonucleoside-triphosphate reductase [Kangiella sp.]
MFEFYLQDAELVNLYHAKKYHANKYDLKFSTKKEKSTMQLNNQDRQKCEVWTRVMGYHRPVSAFNKGKQSEHKERQHFKERA